MRSVLLFFLFSTFAVGQSGRVVCDAVIQDTGANVLSASDIEQIDKSLVPLENLGVEPRVVVGPIGGEPNLDIAMADWAKVCRSWQGPGGGWKSNLLIIGIATDKKKYGVKFLRDGILEKPLGGDQSTQITATYMKPLLRDRNYTKAVEVTAIQLAKRIEASRDEKYKGVVVNNAATDMSGFWRFLMWLLITATCFVVGYYLVRWIMGIRRLRHDTERSHQAALLARNMAVTKINTTRNLIDEYEAVGKDVTPAKNKIGEAMDELSLLQGSNKTDPSQEGLLLAEYNDIKAQYNRVSMMATEAKSLLNERKFTEPEEDQTSAPAQAATPIPIPPRSHHRKRPRIYERPYTPPPPAAPMTTSSTNVVIVNEEPLYGGYRDPFHFEDREPVRHEYSGSTDSYASRDDDPPPSRDWGSSSDDSSGSTSSYDSSSSSSSDGSSGDF